MLRHVSEYLRGNKTLYEKWWITFHNFYIAIIKYHIFVSFKCLFSLFLYIILHTFFALMKFHLYIQLSNLCIRFFRLLLAAGRCSVCFFPLTVDSWKFEIEAINKCKNPLLINVQYVSMAWKQNTRRIVLYLFYLHYSMIFSILLSFNFSISHWCLLIFCIYWSYRLHGVSTAEVVSVFMCEGGFFPAARDSD